MKPKIGLYAASIVFCGELGLATPQDLRDFISVMPKDSDPSKYPTGQRHLDMAAGVALKHLAMKQLAETLSNNN